MYIGKSTVCCLSLKYFLLTIVVIISSANIAQGGQAWKPTKPIRFITHHAAGGGFDMWTRAIARPLEKNIGVTVVVENVVGGGGVTALETVWRSKPNGHTIDLFDGAGALLPQRVLSPRYDVMKFSLIGIPQAQSFALYAAKNSPLNTLEDVVKTAKTKPVRGGTTSITASLWQSMAIFAAEAGIDIRPVAGYKSGADMLVGLQAGDFDLMFVPPLTAMATLKSGSIKAVAVAGIERDPRLPNVPTFREAKYPKTSALAASTRVLAAPPKTPPHIMDFWEKAFSATMKDARFVAWAEKQGEIIHAYNAKKSIQILIDVDKALMEFLPILKQYVQ